MADEDSKEGVKKEGASEHINVKVVTADKLEVQFRIKMSTPLKRLKEAFCKRNGIEPNSVRLITGEGTRIDDDDTATTLNLEEGDVIDATIQQTGGGNEREV